MVIPPNSAINDIKPDTYKFSEISACGSIQPQPDVLHPTAEFLVYKNLSPDNSPHRRSMGRLKIQELKMQDQDK